MSDSQLWRVALTVPEAQAPVFADAIADHVDTVATFEIEEGGTWLVEGTSYGEPNRAQLVARVSVLAEALGLDEPGLTIEALPDVDWLSHSYRGFPPIRAGRFYVHGSHIEGKVPAGAHGLLVDAGTAFGTGEHATTNGCLLALDDLARRFRPSHVLDMGCGSGILALAAARAWKVPVAAVDIDPESVRVARINTVRNGLASWVTVDGGDGYHTPLVRRFGPYPLILSNILARPLARMAPDLARHLAPGGYAVLSGLLTRHERLVIQAHRTQGLHLTARRVIGEWSTLVMRGPGA
ncbi:MAG TPA: 50S ribosomal protein L11 methyltransferase [Azospirillaceae bacterium]|nr:50S ribosomal protein L11 methyltransferase [Azospirillaceae bacterium]